MAGAELLDTASAIVELAHAHDAVVVINDRADLARLAGADGVHVGQDDLPPRDVRTIVGNRAIVGLSMHTIEQIDRAVEQPVSYVAIGPVFGSVTKATGYDRVGIVMVSEAAKRARARGLPLVAIGGVPLVTPASVIQGRAASVGILRGPPPPGGPPGRWRAD